MFWFPFLCLGKHFWMFSPNPSILKKANEQVSKQTNKCETVIQGWPFQGYGLTNSTIYHIQMSTKHQANQQQGLVNAHPKNKEKLK